MFTFLERVERFFFPRFADTKEFIDEFEQLKSDVDVEIKLQDVKYEKLSYRLGAWCSRKDVTTVWLNLCWIQVPLSFGGVFANFTGIPQLWYLIYLAWMWIGITFARFAVMIWWSRKLAARERFLRKLHDLS